jgi:hypothetical protein
MDIKIYKKSPAALNWRRAFLFLAPVFLSGLWFFHKMLKTMWRCGKACGIVKKCVEM